MPELPPKIPVSLESDKSKNPFEFLGDPNFDERTLEREMRAWVEAQIRVAGELAKDGQVNASKLKLRELSGLELFKRYQTNFWNRLPGSSYYFKAEDLLRIEEEGTGVGAEVRRKYYQLSRDIDIAADKLGLHKDDVRTPQDDLNDEREWTVVKQIFIELRRMGYSRVNLTA